MAAMALTKDKAVVYHTVNIKGLGLVISVILEEGKYIEIFGLNGFNGLGIKDKAFLYHIN